jgi:SAM-dependent methyltransferase
MPAVSPVRQISPMTEWYLKILACPECSSSLAQRGEMLFCGVCGFEAACAHNADLRPHQQRTVSLNVQRLCDVEHQLREAELGRPTVTYKGPIGIRDATELLSVLHQRVKKPGQVLDLGCGQRDQAESIEYLGHKYVGIDLSSAQADIRADAHSLPFQSASFDFVFSYAVLEHLHNPLLALHEIGRVLRKGGFFCGTVSQGEPFHNSFFHHTAWGVLSLASASGLKVLRVWPCWDTLSGLAEMGRYPRVLKYGIRTLDLIHRRCRFLSPRKIRWSPKDRLIDEIHRAASIGFIISKSDEH